MVANDYWDRCVDKVNAPNRPIPSGLISERPALIYAVSLMVLGLSTSFLTNISCLVIAVAALLVSLLYSFKGKDSRR
jgi:geranylgeranylglycerol-phosphate geranylgeranyltransferase